MSKPVPIRVAYKPTENEVRVAMQAFGFDEDSAIQHLKFKRSALEAHNAQAALSLQRQVNLARSTMGDKRWAELNREWLDGSFAPFTETPGIIARANAEWEALS